MEKKIPSFPYYLLLIPVFYVWNKINEYWGLLDLDISLEVYGWNLLITAVLFLISLLWTRKIVSAGIITAYCMIIHLFWGSFHDWIKSINIPNFLTTYKFLLVGIFTILIILLIHFKKNKDSGIRLSKFLNLLLLVFLISECAQSLLAINTKVKNAFPVPELTLSSPIFANEKASDSLPNIFVIIFDGYASSKSLKENLNFSNHKIDSVLNTKNFYLAPHSKSNYNLTGLSLSSFLNLNYFSTNLEMIPARSLIQLKGQRAVNESMLPQILEKNGYLIKNIGLMNLNKHNSPYENFFIGEQYSIFKNQTFLYRIDKEILWNIRQYVPLPTFESNNLEKLIFIQTDQVKNKQPELLNLLTTEFDKPIFTYAHFFLPHDPYTFLENGELNEERFNPVSSYNTDFYLSQIQFTNTLIEAIANSVKTNSKRPKVVIILGDHGVRDYHLKYGNRKRSKQFENLTAIYFSDQNYQPLYDSISPVNILRVVSNKYFQTDLPLLKDSTIMTD